MKLGSLLSNPPAEQNGKAANKHDLRIQNIHNLNERIPGLTPPILTPGGRRLPPIQLLPNNLGSPGTPSSNMWSTLLNVTNGNAEHVPGYGPAFPIRNKSGLVPTELSLRLGLTPGLMHHNSFNFYMPEALGAGQMTPGLQNLLGFLQTQMESPLGQPQQRPPVQPNGADQGPAKVGASHAPPPEQNNAPGAPTAPPAGESRPEVIKEEAETPPQPKAKRTKNNKVKKEEEHEDDGKSPEEEVKRKQFLERNRVAALKCRQRKKQLLTKMESELAFYSSGYQELSAQVTQLREQLLTLRGILHNHRDCPALASLVGGPQQLQNVIGQSDFVASVAAKTEPSYTQLPTTVPTTLMPQPPHPQQQPMMVDAPPLPVPVRPREEPHPAEAYEERFNDDEKSNLRQIYSASNLQHVKQNGTDLRPTASMADLQNTTMLPRQFQL